MRTSDLAEVITHNSKNNFARVIVSEPDIPALTEEDIETKENRTETKEGIDERNNECYVLRNHRLDT